jgi:uncharacterized protein YbjT (DUF2867 family)
MKARLLITGATGNVGKELIRLLTEKNAEIVAAIRDPKEAESSLGADIEYVPFDFQRPETFEQAFNRVDKLFLVRPPAISDTKRYINPAIDEAKRLGIQQIVLLSLLGAEKNPLVPHRKIEDYILTTGLPYTFLRPSFFMQNLSTTHREEIKEDNELFVPAGSGKTSFIDVRDIAAVAAKTLLEDGHTNKAYTLTGSEALNYYEVADIFSEVLERKIRYSNPSIFAFIRRTLKKEVPFSFALIMTAIYTTARLGLAARTTAETEQLLNRPPITLREFVKDYRESWI